MHLIADVLPIPGGPDRRIALALRFYVAENPLLKLSFFFYPLSITLSQSFSQVKICLTLDWFPII